MIYFFIIIISISLLYFLKNRITQDTLDTKMYKIGSGIEGSDFQIMGNFIEQNCKNIENITQTAANGGLSNLLKVNKGEYNFGICQERFLINGYNNLIEFKDFEKLDNLRFVSALNFENMTFIVKDFDNVETSGDSNEIVINSFDDLGFNDKIIIGVGEEYSASQNNFEVICSDYGIVTLKCESDDLSEKCNISSEDKDKRKVYYLNGTMNELFNKFYKGKIHGIFMMTGSNNIYIDNLSKIMNIKFIDFYDENSRIITNFNNYFFKKQINTGDYFKEPQKQSIIPTLATRVVLFTNKDMPDNVVYEITKCVYEKHFILANMLNINLKTSGLLDYEPVELAYCPKDLLIHDGAKQYLKTKNIISEEEKYEFDMDYYARELYKNYWEHDTIEGKTFDMSILADKSDETNNLYNLEDICFTD